MAAAAIFDYTAWTARYPAFGLGRTNHIPPDLAQSYFDQAGGFWRNDGTSLATTDALQVTLMYLLTAHLAALFGGGACGSDGKPLVGRISGATEGSVSVEFQWATNISESQAFFSQTQYGVLFWQMTSQYRRFRYRARPTSNYGNSGRWPYGGW